MKHDTEKARKLLAADIFEALDFYRPDCYAFDPEGKPYIDIEHDELGQWRIVFEDCNQPTGETT